MRNEFENKGVRILLASGSAESNDDMEQKLVQAMGASCCIFHSSCIAESINTLEEVDPPIDIIMMDLNLINVGYPSKVFREMDDIVSDIPIIIFNGAIEASLAIFLIEEGASDNVTNDQMVADPFRLRGAIENSIVRHKSLQKIQQKSMAQLIDMRDEWRAAFDRKGANHKKSLNKAHLVHIQEIREKDQIISWLTGGYSVEK